MSKPWMKFYPADWRADPALRSCTMAARGLWMEMLCIMHEAEPYGHLVIKGRPVTDVALASLAGIGLKECRSLLSSLRQVGVFSASPDGVIYSRRMVKDHAKALKDRENGASGGNPALKGGVNPQDKAQKPEARDKRPDSSGRTVQTPSEKPKPDIAACGRAAGAAEVAGKYEFEAGIIKLTARHFGEWRDAFPNLSLRSELMGLVEIAQQIQAEGGNWFMALPRILAKRNREAALAVERIKADALAKAAQPKPVARGYVC